MLTSKYKDFTSGFRATHRLALEKALPEQFLSNQYAYKIQLLWLLHKNKARICEYPIEFIDRQKGVSKLPANSILDSLRVLFLLRFNELRGYFKMCLVGLSGVFLQCIIYNVLRQSLSPIYALKLAIIAAIVNNYVLNNRFTFKDNPPLHLFQKVKSFSMFLVYSVLMISVQSYWFDLGLKYIGSGFIKENTTIFTGIIIGSLLNYLI